ncbi:TIGR03557 family F420-dependent LLM class oxidoreductase [Tamaricihabitans halophyticus]|uniref:TIGR03557 family F420-dependent LLM class oxidoreductase n=1 Tax=Tamaricihabitans halophyticus TaxID=1262583 RepID=UPI0010467209|nr:TIGR03557 family F420-dependent LLM class oxidoreductase [Tamaricihabitans halophyticus]
MRFGYTLMTEQAGPNDLVDFASGAEQAGFDFSVMSDHYFPWLAEQGHSPYAWSLLGAVTQRTEAIELMSYVTCPTMRYHPAVVAQKATTIQLLSKNRFTLGLGAGENLNEHVVGRGWPPVNVRHDMLTEAINIISSLFEGGYVNYRGEHFCVDSAKLWDLPERTVPIATAVSGPQSVGRFALASDAMIATDPDPQLAMLWDRRAGPRARKIAQFPVSWDTDADRAKERAHSQFRWFAGGWKVNAELPGPAGFTAATSYVRKADVAERIPCGPDVSTIIEAARPFAESGFSDIALVQIGGSTQRDFLRFAETELLPELRAAYGH